MSIDAGIYLRISDDTEGTGAGVRRQEEDCRSLCDRKGWTVAEVYEDNDRSAYRGKSRPAYERMLADIKAGRIGAVAVWHLDRLHRNPAELEDFMRVADAANVHLGTATGDVDLSQGDGRFTARIMGAVAAKESDDKSRRLRRKHEELARDGKVAGGGHRPFGFESDRVTINQEEAALIRGAAERLLAGESVRSVATDFEARGVTTSAGNPWTPTAFKRMMLSPRIAGLREHRGETVGEAVWPAIIDEDTHHRLGTRLRPKRTGRSHRQRKYLLTGGLAVCGRCGSALVARPKGDGTPSMVCASGPGFPGCGRIRIDAEAVEEFIGAAVIEALDSPQLTEALLAQTDDLEDRDAELNREIAELEARLEEASRDYYAEQKISRSEFFAARDTLTTRIDQAKARLTRGTRNHTLRSLPNGRDALQAAWDQADTGWRRALIAAVVDHIDVNPAVRGRNRFDPERLTIHWRA